MWSRLASTRALAWNETLGMYAQERAHTTRQEGSGVSQDHAINCYRSLLKTLNLYCRLRHNSATSTSTDVGRIYTKATRCWSRKFSSLPLFSSLTKDLMYA
jgi:hypothetical protein